MVKDPTALSDPQAYLSLRKFNRRIQCPRAGLPVTFADFGDPDGVPLMWVLPSGCSRWLAAPHDPLCKMYGVRMIVVDRPGMGGTGMVSLEERIPKSCEMMASVLDHLGVKLAHILASSAGIYYVLHLLTHHPSIFLTALNPPPTLYLIAPWSPLLPPDHPHYYRSAFAWIPTTLIATQHITLPHLMKVAQAGVSAWDVGYKTLFGSIQAARSWLNPPASDHPPEVHTEPEGLPTLATKAGGSMVPDGDQTASGSSSTDHSKSSKTGEMEDNDDGEEDDEGGGRSGGFWGRCPCCIACLTNDYMQAEEHQGISQEHLLCLNRGSIDTGHRWIEKSFEELSEGLDAAQRLERDKDEKGNGMISDRLRVELFWGWKDGMVPRKGQLWFNSVNARHTRTMDVRIHDIPEGDHSNLLVRADGIYEVYDSVHKQGHSTQRRLQQVS